MVTGPDYERTVGIGSTLTELPLGTYRVAISKQGFEPEVRRLELKDGDKETLVVLLKKPGSLVIKGRPVGAVVELEGPDGFRARDGLPLTLSAHGAVSTKFELAVRDTKLKSWSYELSPTR